MLFAVFVAVTLSTAPGSRPRSVRVAGMTLKDPVYRAVAGTKTGGGCEYSGGGSLSPGEAPQGGAMVPGSENPTTCAAVFVTGTLASPMPVLTGIARHSRVERPTARPPRIRFIPASSLPPALRKRLDAVATH